MKQQAIGLIVIDSIAGVFRLDTNVAVRANDMRKLVNGLQTLSDDHECAIVCVNQVTTAMRDKTNKKQFIPCLGLAWSNLVTTRLTISKTNNFLPSTSPPIQIRSAEITFAPGLPRKQAQFIITSKGIENVE